MARRSAGYTLIEVMIVTSILSVMLGGALQIITTSMRARGVGMATSDVETQVNRSLNRIAWALTGCSRGSIDPKPASPASTSTISYQTATGFVAGVIQWGPTGRIEFQLEPGEVDDGFDNDGDGLVDEGQVVWIENATLPDERTVVIAHKVRRFLEGEVNNGLDDNATGLIDEPGLSFDVTGDILTVRITLERFAPGGVLITRTSETRVKLRNPAS